eukprot:CAMPEP_0174979056 /NCGR_PEP_ID=MMETSP0004_2-20121128/14560_1 /TAXON_ID=420556 /ORGANISM="Ochromonas sp., Strain CCMP1393" /LENGTH=182 /DNA_ID=CAMNT_0016230523 /DNA_START=90 /DNA_END=638 /DNA_ORIENTATION=+
MKRIRSAVLFRADDPNDLCQVMPPLVVNTSVERIKGNRYPSPGSRTLPTAHIPLLENSDKIYNSNYYSRDPRNLQSRMDGMYINSKKNPALMSTEAPRQVTHGKRAIADLKYDPSGLRTTKTATWEALAPVLDAHAPDHLPGPEWLGELDSLQAEREAKGLPRAEGRRYKMKMDDNYTEVRW